MDYGSRYADRRQRAIEKRLQEVYSEAQKDLQAKFGEFLSRHEAQDKIKRQMLENGEITIQQYRSWMMGQVFQQKQWQAKVDDATHILQHANEESLHVIRGEQFNVYAECANYEAYTIERSIGSAVNFNLYNEQSVQRLITKKPALLPPKKINGRKDRAWNKDVIANAVTQSIIQGEGIPGLAKRLAHDTASTDMKAMTRYARTAMTAAHSAGQMDSMHRAKDMGIRIQKQWIATLDNKTRDSHRYLDGQTVELDEPFHGLFGDIMEPGDPNADPADVYNCRCRMIRVFPDYPADDPDWREKETIDGMTYQEWKENK